ncbi:MAG TPA: pyruvate kinase alpha/beta domain-containing protein [bacterium]|nr:pyruvate kinase alpha/beta domain-containing protein [bacterium]
MELWAQSGEVNTEATVAATIKRANELKIDHVVVASNTGTTARHFLDSGLKVICVTHQVGFREPGGDEMPAVARKNLQAAGIEVLTTTHLFRGINRGIADIHGGYDPGMVISDALRLFGQGTKVAVEVAIMALDAGLIPYGYDIVSVAGTSRGADTALVLRPAHSGQFLQSQIREIICKPRSWGKQTNK